jgi:DNA uptake protein ComE-like DNA-binding protein
MMPILVATLIVGVRNMRQWVVALAIGMTLVGCREDAPVEPPATSQPGPAVTTPEPAAAAAAAIGAAAKVNLNTATREALLAIPEVTERMAHEFDEYRPYVSIRQFRREMGKYVDEAQVARYEKHVFVPIAVNECDAETLRQIPGLDAAAADALIAGRPYATADAFLTALASHVDPAAAAVARTYLAE